MYCESVIYTLHAGGKLETVQYSGDGSLCRGEEGTAGGVVTEPPLQGTPLCVLLLRGHPQGRGAGRLGWSLLNVSMREGSRMSSMLTQLLASGS